MQRSWIIGLAAVAGLTLGAGCQDRTADVQPLPSQQDEQAIGGSGVPAAQGQAQGQQQQERSVVGRVASVSENELIVQDTYKKAHKLEITDETQIIGTGTGLSAQPELLQGIDVRVSFSGEGGDQVAKRIEVLRADTSGQGQQNQE